MSTTCKEQCTTCKCIVKEKVLSGGGEDKCGEDKCGEEKKQDCSALYKQLGCCIQQCMMEKCKEQQKKNSGC